MNQQAPIKYHPPTHSVRRRVRVAKEQAAFLYTVLESQEGTVAYTTLPQQTPGDLHRDLELFIPPDFVGEIEALLKSLGDLVYEIPSHN